MIGTFDEALSLVRTILDKHWDILWMDPDLKKCLDDHPSITFRRGKNLRDRLTHCHYNPPAPQGNWLSRQPKGCLKCSGCVACDHIETGSSFASTSTNKWYKVNQFINCCTTKVVYLATCSFGLQDVGKTTCKLMRRIGEHVGDIYGNNMKATQIISDLKASIRSFSPKGQVN